MSTRRGFLKAVTGAAAGAAAVAAGVKLQMTELARPKLSRLPDSFVSVPDQHVSTTRKWHGFDLQAGHYRLDYEDLKKDLLDTSAITDLHRGKDS